MARSTPPTLISYTEVAYSQNSPTATSASVSWLAGDVIVVIVMDEGVATIGTPTATGLTFTSPVSNNAAGTCASRGAYVVAAAGGSSAVSATLSTGHGGLGVWVWRGSEGIGSSVEQHTTTRTKALVPVDTHSAYCWTVGDFAAGATTSVVLTPTPTTTQESALDVGHYTVYSGNLNDQASAASTNFGTSGGTVTGPSSIIAMEVLGRNVAPLTTVPMRATRG